MLLDKDHPGKFLAYRFLSTERGFEYLNQTDFIQRELALWAESESENYVRVKETKGKGGVCCYFKSFYLGCGGEAVGNCVF